MSLVYNIYVIYTVYWQCIYVHTYIYLHNIRVVPFRHLGEQIARICRKLVGNWWNFSPNYGGNIATVTWLRGWKSVDGLVWRWSRNGRFGKDFRNPSIVEIVRFPQLYHDGCFFGCFFCWVDQDRIFQTVTGTDERTDMFKMALWREYQCILCRDLMRVAYHSALWWYYVSIKLVFFLLPFRFASSAPHLPRRLLRLLLSIWRWFDHELSGDHKGRVSRPISVEFGGWVDSMGFLGWYANAKEEADDKHTVDISHLWKRTIFPIHQTKGEWWTNKLVSNGEQLESSFVGLGIHIWLEFWHESWFALPTKVSIDRSWFSPRIFEREPCSKTYIFST